VTFIGILIYCDTMTSARSPDIQAPPRVLSPNCDFHKRTMMLAITLLVMKGSADNGTRQHVIFMTLTHNSASAADDDIGPEPSINGVWHAVVNINQRCDCVVIGRKYWKPFQFQKVRCRLFLVLRGVFLVSTFTVLLYAI